jgi:hypothetical protein
VILLAAATTARVLGAKAAERAELLRKAILEARRRWLRSAAGGSP